jgi:sugar lactone lactonase YvrE
MKKKKIWIVAFLLTTAHLLLGVIPQSWELYRMDDFIAGKFDGISISHEGTLSLSPKEEDLEGPTDDFYLSLLIASDGTKYLGTGHSGKIYKVGTDGQFELLRQLPEMDVYCLAMDRYGNLFAGTSPNGQIYKITPRGESQPFFNPNEKYIWDLVFADNGALLAAVGESGGIYRINDEGEGRKIVEVEENHILCMKKALKDELIAGSGGRGVIYRITPGKKAAVLYESSYEEIKSIALDSEGNIYAAASGKVVEPKKDATSLLPTRQSTSVTVTATPSAPATKAAIVSAEKEPGAVYRIDPDGLAKKLWSSDDELVYSLLWDERTKKIVFGTGNKGRIYEIDADEKISLVLQKESEQVYYLLARGTAIFALSNNPSRLSRISPEQRFEGEYQSRVLDAKTLSKWGRIEWNAELPNGAIIQFLTRSGNSAEPDRTWSDWSPPYQNTRGEQILSPKGRYLQFMAKFKAESSRMSPVLNKVMLFYLHSNLPPTLMKLDILAPNIVYLKPPQQEDVIWGEKISLSEQAINKNKSQSYMAPKRIEKKGYRTVTWEAQDANSDSLLYSVFIRREDETRWRVLEPKWADKILAFNTSIFPDGIYFVKVEASDSPSNPKGTDLKAEKISRPLVIDNSLPIIRNFQVERQRNSLSVSFGAVDANSHIKEAKFLIRPGDWQVFFPEDGICDSKSETFRFETALPSGADNMIIVRVTDRHGNIGVHRATF